MPEEQNSDFGNLPHSLEQFGSVPNDSAPFRNLPQPSEAFRNVPKVSERKENHILTVREAARLFEDAGVTRTERSITNWCQPNRSGVARLDAYFDSNDRKYFITPQSVDAAIKEELAKAAKHSEPAEAFGNVPHASDGGNRARPQSDELDVEETEELRFRLRESEIASKMKDQYIAKLETRYDEASEKLLSYSRTLGQLETKLLQLEGPKPETNDPRKIPVVSERESSVSERE